MRERAPRASRLALALSLAAATVTLILAPAPAQARRTLDVHWRSLATEHFDIHYYEGEELLAQKVAHVAEHAWQTLVPLFRVELVDRPQVVVTDHLDTANGIASVAPYDHIELYAFPPEADGELGSYDDYLHMLFFHEFTHILHINTVGGVPWLVNTVIGKTSVPNAVLPTWYKEGIAVTVESRTTGRGRVYSSRTDMVLRAAVLGGTWLTLDELTGSPQKRPRGSGWYLYGGQFINWIADRVGFDKLIDFNHAYGRRVVPYGLNILARETLGEDFVTLYDRWSAEVAERARAFAAQLAERGAVEGKPLTSTAEEHRTPRLSPDGRRLAYLKSDGHERQSITIIDLESGAERAVRECDGFCHALSWRPDGRRLVYNRYERHRTVYQRRQLFEVDVETGVARRLTDGQRVRDPDASPTGERVVWVEPHAGQMALMMLDSDRNSIEPLVPRNGFDQLATPRFSPDGRRVAYSAWVDGDGRRDLFVVDVDGGEPRRLTWDDEMDLHVCWSPDGRYVLFSSDRGGAYNIHALRVEDGARFQVTDVLTGAFRPDVDRAGRNLVYLRYGANGYDVWALPYEPSSWRPQGGTAAASPGKTPYAPPETVVADEGTYNPLPTLRPFRLEPSYYLDQTGLSTVGAIVSGNDAVRHHYWLASVDYDIQNGRISEALVYANRQLPVDLGFSVSHFTWQRSAFFEDRVVEFEERVVGGSVDASIPFPHVRSGFSIGTGWTFRWTGEVDMPTPQHEPDDLVPYVPAAGLLSGAYLSWSYSDVTRVLYGFDGEKGRSLWMRLNLNHAAFGSEFETVSITWSWKEYLLAPWGHHHVFILKLKGGIAAGHGQMRRAFSLGGVPPQDLFSAIANQQGLSGDHLRGYAPGTFNGDQYYLLTAEFRFPIWEVFRGVETLPAWAGRLTGAVFADTGRAFSGPLSDAEPSVGIGAEVRLGTTLFYSFGANFRLGYAYGLMEEGEHQFYVLLGSAP